MKSEPFKKEQVDYSTWWDGKGLLHVAHDSHEAIELASVVGIVS